MKKLIEIEKKMGREEVYKALADERIFVDFDRSETLRYDPSTNNPFRCISESGDTPLLNEWASITHEEIEEEWYENIPEHGILCWVWTDDESFKVPAFVYSYALQDTYSFRCCPDISIVRDLNDYVFKNATPMTASEVQKYIITDLLTNELSGDR